MDTEAKRATEGKTSDKKSLPPLLRKQLKQNKSALKQEKSSQLKKRWAQEWKVSPRYNKIKAIDSSLPSNKFLKLISDDRLSRLNASQICQLRTGHVPLNTYLKRIGRVTGASCPACGHPREDARHFLVDCPSYAHERWPLYRLSKTRNPSLRKLLSVKKLLVPVANFIQATGHFKRGGREKGQEERDETQEGQTQER